MPVNNSLTPSISTFFIPIALAKKGKKELCPGYQALTAHPDGGFHLINPFLKLLL